MARSMLFALASLAVYASPAIGQTVVVALEPNAAAAVIVRFGAFIPEPVPLGEPLQIGDELRSERTGTILELRCGNSASPIVLTDKFRVAVLPPSSQNTCATNLLAGTALVTAVQPGEEVRAGEVAMVSKSTMYEVTVRRGEGGAGVSGIAVFDGEVALIGALGSAVAKAIADRTVRAGQKLSVRQSTAVWDRIGERDIAEAATLFARLDLSRIPETLSRTERRQAYDNLRETYRQVLARPGTGTPHLQLAARHLEYGIASPVTVHQLTRAEALAGDNREQRAVIAVTKGATYQQLGDQQNARVEYDKAAKLVPDIRREGRLKAYRLPEGVVRQAEERPVRRAATVPQAMNVEVRPATNTTVAGRPVAIHVTARTGSGSAVEDAWVTIEAGGGLFRRSRSLLVRGQTDRQGRFTADWVCQPCAPSYRMTIVVEKSGFVDWKGDLSLSIRRD
jgi:hypothetical protein